MRTRIRRELRRIRLRRAAVRYAEHGWDVVPGAILLVDRFRCGPGCRTVSCHPYRARWEESATRDPRLVAEAWGRTPHAVLLATGRAFDVLEVPACLGASTARATLRGPLAMTANGRWMFLVRPGSRLRPQLAARPDVVLHGAGSWIPAPPTATLEGQVRWAVRPEEVDWQLPDPWAVQASAAAMLPVLRSAGSTVPAPRTAAWPARSPGYPAANGRPPGRCSRWRESPTCQVTN